MKNYLTARSASTVSGYFDSDLVVVSEAEVTPAHAQSSYDNITVPSDNGLKTSSSNPILYIQPEDQALVSVAPIMMNDGKLDQYKGSPSAHCCQWIVHGSG